MRAWGPSPRARGAHRRGAGRRACRGTIPAGAGSTAQTEARRRSTGDHPRGRGEHQAGPDAVASLTGPSPRARGAQSLIGTPPPKQGTIPAGAGSTPPRPGRRPPRRDHPRGRGEHERGRMCPSQGPGPSPRARGAHFGECAVRPERGTIPAGAGSTSRRRTATSWTWDHPRGRGEHLKSAKANYPDTGPSPRARGARVGSAVRPAVAGTIPAGAGSTRTRGGGGR